MGNKLKCTFEIKNESKMVFLQFPSKQADR